MGDVLAFPTRAVHVWAVMEKEFRSRLRARGADEAMTTAVMARMQGVAALVVDYDNEVSVELPVPACATESERATLLAASRQRIEAVQRQVHQLVFLLLAERLARECEVYRPGTGS